MNTRTHLLSLVIGTCVLLTGGCIERRVIVEKPPQQVVVQQPSPDVVVAEPPPADKVEVVNGAAPGPEYVWVRGYWIRQGPNWMWVPGVWVQRPHANAVWVAGHWQHYANGWAWVPGHWI
jgi:hypothetical protein